MPPDDWEAEFDTTDWEAELEKEKDKIPASARAGGADADPKVRRAAKITAAKLLKANDLRQWDSHDQTLAVFVMSLDVFDALNPAGLDPTTAYLMYGYKVWTDATMPPNSMDIIFLKGRA